MALAPQANTRLVRGALFANAVFSFVCAAALLFDSQPIASALFATDRIWFEQSASRALLGLGAGLAMFVGIVAFRASQKTISPSGVRSIIVGDVLWIVVSIAAIATGADYLTPAGQWTIELVAVAVLVFAVAQLAGLGVLYQGASDVSIARVGETRKLHASLEVNAPAAVAWRVMTDHKAYADVADNLTRVEILDGSGKGMSRKCTGTKGESWTESAHLWEDGERYGFTVNTAAPDYPYPLEQLSAVWSVAKAGEAKCVVSMEFTVLPRRGFKGAMFIRVSMVLFPKLIDRLLVRWKERMEREASA